MEPREDAYGQYERGAQQNWLFEDRSDAGAQLANQLLHYRGENPLVLGIPRGGVPVAYEVAQRLGGDLDVIVARKIGAPDQEEFGIGAIASDGSLYINDASLARLDVSDATLARLTQEQRLEAVRREKLFRAGLAALRPAGRIVIVVDDGLATGATMRAAVRSLKARGAEKIVVAVPVGADETCRELEREVAELVCPYRPFPFHAVGQHYGDFEQTSDQEVELLLRKHREARALSSRNRPRPS